MAGDLATMKARIVRELRRPDLTAEIADAINDAIAAYQGERFRFSDIAPLAPPVFNTEADRWVYGAADNANISTLLSIGALWATVGNSLQPLSIDSPAHIRQYNQLGTMKGQPMWWAYEGNSLLIAPVPDKAYVITMDVFRRVPAPADDAEVGNPWMTDAEQMIRARAKYEIAVHVTRNPTMAVAMAPDPPASGQLGGSAAWRAWRDLKAEGNRVTSLGRVRAMPF